VQNTENVLEDACNDVRKQRTTSERGTNATQQPQRVRAQNEGESCVRVDANDNLDVAKMCKQNEQTRVERENGKHRRTMIERMCAKMQTMMEREMQNERRDGEENEQTQTLRDQNILY